MSGFWKTVRNLLDDGESVRLRDLNKTDRNAIEFNRLYGIGPKRAMHYADLGYTTPEQVVEMEGDDLPDGIRIVR